MAEFVCKVADAGGRIFSQVEAAQSATEAKQKLSDRGLYVYSIEQRGGFLAGAVSGGRSRVVKSDDFLVFNQQFNTLVKAGLPILKALDLLATRAASPKLRPILLEVRDRVREGASLSEALDQMGVFPKVYVTAVLAGEKSGNLTGVLDYYIAYQRVSSGVRKKLIATLIYPCILVTLATVIVLYLVTYVVPQFAGLYADMHIALPAVTQVLLVLTVTYRSYLLAGIGVLLLLIIGMFLWSFTEQGAAALDRVKLRFPVLGDVWIKFQVAQFSRTLSTLLTGGTPLVPALATAADSIGNRLVAVGVARAAQLVKEGQPLHQALGTIGLFPELGLEMIEVGEASGELSNMLGSIAQFYEDETNQKMTTLIALVEPAILMFMAVVIAFVLIALYLPLFSFSVTSGS